MALSYLLHLSENENRNKNKSHKRTDAASFTEIKQGAAASSTNPEVCFALAGMQVTVKKN